MIRSLVVPVLKDSSTGWASAGELSPAHPLLLHGCSTSHHLFVMTLRASAFADLLTELWMIAVRKEDQRLPLLLPPVALLLQVMSASTSPAAGPCLRHHCLRLEYVVAMPLLLAPAAVLEACQPRLSCGCLASMSICTHAYPYLVYHRCSQTSSLTTVDFMFFKNTSLCMCAACTARQYTQSKASWPHMHEISYAVIQAHGSHLTPVLLLLPQAHQRQAPP